MKLRPHQELAIQMCRESIARGNRRVVIGACTSFGKTLTAIEMMRAAVAKGKRAVFICDRIKLVEQTLEACDKLGIPCGVIQGDHWRTDYRHPIQIASAQTLQRRIEKWGTRMFDFDLAIHDECHVLYEWQKEIMSRLSNIVWIGLSATPFSKGLGQHYQDLVVPITAEELLDQGYLAPVRYYAGRGIDVSKVKKRALQTGGSDFDPKALGEATENDTMLTGDIIKNWMKWGENRQTVAFTPSIRHSKHLVEQFRSAGIDAEHIDGFIDQDLRELLFEAHSASEFKVLSCSRLLNTGWDSPTTSCIIDAFPTRSPITWVQRVGRGMRTHPDKTDCIYLDHAGNVERMGFAELVVPESLDDGSKRFNERDQIKEQKKESKPRECPACFQQMVGLRCKACGYEVPITEALKHDDQILEEVGEAKKDGKAMSMDQKAVLFSELLFYADTRGYSRGWAAHKYREKTGVWPRGLDTPVVGEVSQGTLNWLKHKQIQWAKRREKA